MKQRTWSLIPLSTVIVAAALWLLVIVGCIFVFNSYVESLNRDSQTLLGEALTELRSYGNGRNAPDAAQRIATRLFPPTLIIVFIGPLHRVTVFHRTRSPVMQAAEVVIRDRDDRSAEPTTTGIPARLTLGFASICGLAVQRGHYESLDIYVKSNDRALVENIEGYAVPFGMAFVLTLLASVLISRIFTARSLRPLVEVTDALERFAAGDLSPQFVATSSQAELGRLARAYNGAVAQVERAFGERERANAVMRQFIGDAGHQLRTPLTVIRGFVALLIEQDDTPPEERRRMLRVTAQQITLMRVLIDNLMLLDRWEEDSPVGTAEAIDVSQLVDDLVTMTRDTNPARALKIEAEADLRARIDPHELTYAVTNILDNALKYTGGTISVTVAGGGEMVQIAIADDGPGMTADVALHAFDRFYRGGRRDVRGSGLGLAIAQKAIARAGGSIDLVTSPQSGTSVRIELPRALDN